MAKLIATLGLLMIAQAIVSERFGTSGIATASVLSENSVHVLGTTAPVSRFVLGGMVVALAAGLSVAYRFTRFGVMTRAASENDTAALLGGLSPDRLSRINTTAAFAIAATPP